MLPPEYTGTQNHYGFSTKMVDVKTAFLWWDLEDKMLIVCPEELEEAKPTDSLVLN